MPQNFAAGVRWDLSDLYSSVEDPRIQTDLGSALTKAQSFAERYRPFFEKNEQASLLPIDALVGDLKEIIYLLTKPAVFSRLSFSEQTNRPGAGAFMQKIQLQLTEIQNHLVFFEVAWNRLDPQTVDSLIAKLPSQPDRHYLQKIRIYAPHTLAEGEEKIMSIKSNTSSRAFSRLFDEVINNIDFYVLLENGRDRVRKNESEVLALFHSPDREKRKEASDSLAEGLKKHSHILTYIYNMILADHRSSLQIRRYAHPMDAMNLSNEISLGSVLSLVESVKAAYPLASRYYNLKRRMLKLPELFDYDRYAPIESDETKMDFAACKEIVLEGYSQFSPKAGEIAEQFFTKHWIDAEIRDGKQGGGFCCQTTPDLHPYILVNYTGSLRDVMTVAHEIGHGLHQYLAGRKVGILESDAPLTLAETASVFGEMLIFERLMEKEKSPQKKLALLCGKIDDQFATVFRQIAMTDFELKAHAAGRRTGELSEDTLNKLWLEANAEFYGKSVILTENYRHGWKYIPHFVHSPFYCYAYAFAQLFVLTLFHRYIQEPAAFVPKYFEMLECGGSRKPEEIAAIAGLDFNKPEFWKNGLDLLETWVVSAESLFAK